MIRVASSLGSYHVFCLEGDPPPVYTWVSGYVCTRTSESIYGWAGCIHRWAGLYMGLLTANGWPKFQRSSVYLNVKVLYPADAACDYATWPATFQPTRKIWFSFSTVPRSHMFSSDTRRTSRSVVYNTAERKGVFPCCIRRGSNVNKCSKRSQWLLQLIFHLFMCKLSRQNTDSKEVIYCVASRSYVNTGRGFRFCFLEKTYGLCKGY